VSTAPSRFCVDKNIPVVSPRRALILLPTIRVYVGPPKNTFLAHHTSQRRAFPKYVYDVRDLAIYAYEEHPVAPVYAKKLLLPCMKLACYVFESSPNTRMQIR
jgi:hypothetical protein